MGMFSTIRIDKKHLPYDYSPCGGYWQTKDLGYGDRFVLRAGKLKQFFSFGQGTSDYWWTWADVPYHGDAEVYSQQEDDSFVVLDIWFYQGEFKYIREAFRGDMHDYWAWRNPIEIESR